MRSFAEILEIAIARKGSADTVLAAKTPKSADELAAIPDHRWLSAMAGGIFTTGLSTSMVRAKWPGIEEAFHGFDVGRVSMMDDTWFDALLSDRRVIRSGPKITAIRENAVFIRNVAAEAGSFGRKVGDWPQSDFAGLVQWLVRNGSRLGGSTGPYVLRYLGKDGFIPSRDVVARLVAEGVVEKAPATAKTWAAAQAAFNRWQTESGLTLTQISRVLAQSIDAG